MLGETWNSSGNTKKPHLREYYFFHTAENHFLKIFCLKPMPDLIIRRVIALKIPLSEGIRLSEAFEDHFINWNIL